MLSRKKPDPKAKAFLRQQEAQKSHQTAMTTLERTRSAIRDQTAGFAIDRAELKLLLEAARKQREEDSEPPMTLALVK